MIVYFEILKSLGITYDIHVIYTDFMLFYALLVSVSEIVCIYHESIIYSGA